MSVEAPVSPLPGCAAVGSRSPEFADHFLEFLQKVLGHELPNQLIAVQGLTRLLEQEAVERLGPAEREYVQRLSAAAQRSHETVRALADAVRAVRTSRSVAAIQVAEVVRETVTEMLRMQPGRLVVYRFPTPSPCWHLSALTLRQALQHLLRAIWPDPGERLEVGAKHDELWLASAKLISQRLGNLFEPAASVPPEVGSVLGTTLARHIVASWGGSLQLQSEEGQGRRLVITAGPAAGDPGQEQS